MQQRILIVLAALLAGAYPASAVTVHVPADQPNIQAGIDAAFEGDTVLVAPGTYTGVGNHDIDFGGKDVVLKSEAGPAATIIHPPGGSYRGLNFHSGETPLSVVDGFTIQGAGAGGIYIYSSSPRICNNIINACSAGEGGGIACYYSSSAISDNVISGCVAGHDYYYGYGYGGGILSGYSSPTITGNTITANHAVEMGGIGCYGGSPIIRDNTISNNSLYEHYFGNGAGLCCYGIGFAIIEGNTISNNVLGSVTSWYSDPRFGGGILISGAYDSVAIIDNTVTGNRGGGIDCRYVVNLTISNNSISGNNLLPMRNFYDGRLGSAGIHLEDVYGASVSHNRCTDNGGYTGGGIACSGSNIAVDACWFEANRGGEGGAAYFRGDGITISNCVIVGNFSTRGAGGGLCAESGSPVVSNCTFYGNRSGVGDGLAILLKGASPNFSNCIIAGHSWGALVVCDESGGVSAPIFADCDIFGNADGNWTGCIAGQQNVNGNFSSDPLFCDTASEDFALSIFSPCAPENNSGHELIGAIDVGCGVCGDADGDGDVTVADVVFLKEYYFNPAAPWPVPLQAGDPDCSGFISLADIVYLADYLYRDGEEPCCPKYLGERPGLLRDVGGTDW